MSVNISPLARQQFFDTNGDPLAGGKLFTYLAGTTTKQATYTTSAGTVANANPIVLDANGYAPNGIWLTDGVDYKFTLAPSTDTDPPISAIWTEDNISGVNDPTGINNEWVLSGYDPVYINATSFSVTGDQTLILHVGRRIKTTNTAGTIYSTITASSFASSITTVTVVNDNGILDSGLSDVSYGTLSYTNQSMPKSSGKEVFTTSGTFTPPSAVHTIFVTAAAGGGGGGGGGGTGTASTVGSGGGGGGAGQSIVKTSYTVVPGTAYTITIGAGGAGGTGGASGTDNSTDGSDGGNTSVGALVTLTGGSGGGRGLIASTGNVLGGAGGSGYPGGGRSTVGGSTGGNAFPGMSGCGGASFFGGAGPGVRSNTTTPGITGDAAYGYGSGGGGGGASILNPASGGTGGAGKDGIVIIEW